MPSHKRRVKRKSTKKPSKMKIKVLGYIANKRGQPKKLYQVCKGGKVMRAVKSKGKLRKYTGSQQAKKKSDIKRKSKKVRKSGRKSRKSGRKSKK